MSMSGYVRRADALAYQNAKKRAAAERGREDCIECGRRLVPYMRYIDGITLCERCGAKEQEARDGALLQTIHCACGGAVAHGVPEAAAAAASEQAQHDAFVSPWGYMLTEEYKAARERGDEAEQARIAARWRRAS